MNAIGGYFELELPKNKVYHKKALALNTGRNAFEYVLRANRYKKVYLPYFTCEAVLEPLKKNGIKYGFYNINEYLEPLFNYDSIKNNEAFLYTNYFGLKDAFIEKMATKIKNLIVDNSQALFAKPIKNIDTFYSPRKYVGVSDGAFLYCNKKLDFKLEKDISYKRMSHLLIRADISAESGYNDFNYNDNSLINQPIKLMSNLTEKILKSIDFDEISKIRKRNFTFLNDNLKDINLLSFDFEQHSVPMVFPFKTKDSELKSRLQKHKIYCASYWPNVLNWCESDSLEVEMTKEIVSLPIDQRYAKQDMCRIIKIIKNEYTR